MESAHMKAGVSVMMDTMEMIAVLVMKILFVIIMFNVG